jgi:hypothetical protein
VGVVGWKRGASAKRVARLSAAILLGLALAGCGGKSTHSAPRRQSSQPATPLDPGTNNPSDMDGSNAPPEIDGSVSGTGGSGPVGTAGSGGQVWSSLGGFMSAGAPAVPDDDPIYPPARWTNADSWRQCPAYTSAQGISCFHTDGGRSELCQGGSDCNTCLCFVPCGPNGFAVCPGSVSGQGRPECLRLASQQDGSCSLTCEEDDCPPGMSCVWHPEYERRVCMWVQP